MAPISVITDAAASPFLKEDTARNRKRYGVKWTCELNGANLTGRVFPLELDARVFL